MLKPQAQVIVRRLEEQPQGLGAPAGWLPEIRYHLTATDIPYKPEGYVFSLRPKARFILRKLVVPAVSSTLGSGWDLQIKIGNRTACPRISARTFSEFALRTWPALPETVARGEDIFLTLFLRGEERVTGFECFFVGTEDKS